jgi:hypothetical protein
VRIPIALALSLLLIPALGLAGVAHAQAPAPNSAPVPVWGIVLGTVAVAGLLYLMVHGPDGGYYRYPYYGAYYQHYYHREYRPYTGFYPKSALVVIAAPHVAGVALGVVIVGGHHYVLSRDAAGHLYRYPYYGPYRQVYYRPEYHDYHGIYVGNGAYRSAPVRLGDVRWDNDKRNLAPAFQQPRFEQRPSSVPNHEPQPSFQQHPQPNYQPNHQPQYNSNQRHPQPNYQPNHQPQYNRNQQHLQSNNQPSHQPQYNHNQQHPRQPNANQNGGRNDRSGGQRPQQRCGHSGEPSCPNNNGHP